MSNWTHFDGKARMPELVLLREQAQLDAETLGYQIGFGGALVALDKALARIYLLENQLRGDNVVPFKPKSVA